jgi:hypothetical protein
VPVSGALLAFTLSDDDQVRIDPVPLQPGEPSEAFGYGYSGGAPSMTYRALLRCVLGDRPGLGHVLERARRPDKNGHPASELWHAISTTTGPLRLPWPRVHWLGRASGASDSNGLLPTPGGRFSFHVLSTLDELTAALTREGSSPRTPRTLGSRGPYRGEHLAEDRRCGFPARWFPRPDSWEQHAEHQDRQNHRRDGTEDDQDHRLVHGGERHTTAGAGHPQHAEDEPPGGPHSYRVPSGWIFLDTGLPPRWGLIGERAPTVVVAS